MEMQRKLREWFASHARDLPWRHTRDPYLIWLSETMLQQTRVDQVLPYYKRFVKRFPDVKSLAAANDDEVFRLWEGLGYYRRAQNMLKAARKIAETYQGQFPSTYTELLSLPGVGPYTAAAIASFAFHIPVAVADGNVMRVLSRLFDIREPVNTPAGQKIFRQKALAFLDRKYPAIHNQAMMELGALICTPRSPRCEQCPLRHSCMAYEHSLTGILPVRLPKTKPAHRRMDYLISVVADKVALQKRNKQDIWYRLYEFVPISIEAGSGKKTAGNIRRMFGLPKSPELLEIRKHVLTHRRLEIYFWFTDSLLETATYVPTGELKHYSLPVPLRQVWEKYFSEGIHPDGRIK